MIKLCIFDLDGTLVDSLDDLAFSINRAMKTHGLPARSRTEVQYALGIGVDYLVKTGIPEALYSEELHKRIKAEHVAYYSGHCTDRTRPYAGIPEMLQTLHETGLKLAVSTNKPHIFLDKIMHDLFEGVPFVKITAAGEYPHKPDPTGVVAILEENHVQREESLYIGDTDIDIKTAINAGVGSVGVTWGFRTREELAEAGAKNIIARPGELVDLVQKLNTKS